MKGCRITDKWQNRGIRTVILENRFIKATILVDYGAKIFELIHKDTDKDFLFHNPRVEPRVPVFGADVDNWWAGGIDELLPTGDPCTYKGEKYPYHGELWSLPWDYDITNRSSGEVSIHLWRRTIISPFLVEKWISLREGEKILHFHHKITNLSNSDVEFNWGIHPGLNINPDCRIDLPAEDTFIEKSFPDDRLGKRGTIYKWPYAADKEGCKVDMRQVPPPEAGIEEYHYAVKLTDGWLALTDTAVKEGIGLVFPKEIFKVIWYWVSFGGWRGLYCAAIEPWTGYPAKLSEAVEKGIFMQLGAEQALECDTKIVIYTGVSQVNKITPAGEVTG